MTFEIGAANLPDLLAGIGMLAIAALLLWVAPHNRVHRGFALLQVVTGLGSLAYAARLGVAESDPLLSSVWSRMGGYFLLALPFAAAFFTLRFLDAEGASRVSRPISWALLVGVVAALGAFALDGALAFSVDAEGRTVMGPLALAWLGTSATFGAMALVFALGALRTEAAARRDGLLLASLAVVVLAAYTSAFYLIGRQLSVANPFIAATATPTILLLAQALPWVGALAVVASTAIVLARTSRFRIAFAAAATCAALTGAAVAVLASRDSSNFGGLHYTIDGVWRAVMTVILAYALLKRQVFDVEVKLRFAISRSTMAAVFVAVFFVASELAQQLFGAAFGGAYAGIIAAGALVFAMAPLQRAAERLAEKAVPVAGAVASAPAPAGRRREEAYRDALRIALHDRRVTRAEEVRLHRLADELGIPPSRAHQILADVEEEVRR